MKLLSILLTFSALILFACNNGNNQVDTPQEPAQTVTPTDGNNAPIPGTAVTQEQLEDLKPNANIPEGVFAVKKVNFAPEISQFMVQKGTRTFDQKCKSCHTLRGTGSSASAFEGMYERHDPAWVFNMVRNVPIDGISRQMKSCPVRSDEGALEVIDARDLLEMIRTVSPVAAQ